MDCSKTTARRSEKHLSFGIWCVLYKRFYGNCYFRDTDLNALDEVLELWTNEGAASIRSVDVEPDFVLVAHPAKFVDVVEGTNRGRSQGSTALYT